MNRVILINKIDDFIFEFTKKLGHPLILDEEKNNKYFIFIILVLFRIKEIQWEK